MTPQESLKRMKQASHQFYMSAVHTHCHAFIEFCGLMNEFIAVCENYQKNHPDKDFRNCNAHTGNQLELGDWHKNYIQEKLTCIYQNDVFN